MSIYDSLNKEQREAVFCTEGPLLMLAGAGTGKTRSLTHRIVYMIEEKGVNPWNILAITFTNKAAEEMRERAVSLVGPGSENLWISTFYATCSRILRRHADLLGYNRSFTIYDASDQKSLMKEVLKSMKVDTKQFPEKAVLSAISAAKDECKSPLDYRNDCGDNYRDIRISEIYEEYQKRLKENDAMDFDDLLVKTVELFQAHPDILDYYQERFRYIMVDEYQDTNTVQFMLVKLLASKYRNLCVVGDDDQSIYRFRGARPELMLGFPKDYPQCGRVLLDVNYRSTPQIVEAAGRLIAHNKTRFAKEIRAVRRPGRPVITRVFQDGAMEAEAICRELRDYAKAGVKWEQMAVLFRTNLGPRLLVEKLMEYNIPFCLRDELPNLFDHWIARNILDYILAARGHMERARILSIINRPKRYVSRDALEGEMINWEQVKSFYQDKGWMVERIEDLEIHLMSIKKMVPAAAVNYIRKAVGYNEFLKEYAAFRRMKPEELYEIADQVQESAAQFQTAEAWFQHIARYREQLKEQARERNQKREGVSLMTMHSSKGLEFRVVFILDANEGVTPHHKAFLDADMEEERRMFYVAMTRAKERLHVYYVKERYHKKQEVSRFVKEYLEQEAK